MNLKYPGMLIIVLLLSENIFAQRPSYGKYTITTQPLQFTCRDVPITVERIFKRITLGATLAYRFDSDFERNPIGAEYWVGRSAGFTTPRFQAVTIGLSSKFFFYKKSRMYLEAQLFYRYWWHNKMLHRENSVSGYYPEYNSSAKRHVAGLKLLCGMSCIPAKKRKVNPIFNWYYGIGLRRRDSYEYGEKREVSSYGFSGSSPWYPHIYKDKEYGITLHAGFNLGVEVFSKNRLVK